jgi:hypothetical protein
MQLKERRSHASHEGGNPFHLGHQTLGNAAPHMNADSLCGVRSDKGATAPEDCPPFQPRNRNVDRLGNVPP